MPYKILENAYAALDETEQKEVVDFVLYLISRKQKKHETNKDVDFSFVENMFGTLSDSEAEEMERHCHLHFKESV